MKIFKYSVIVLITFILLFPIYFMIIGSLQNVLGIMKMPPNLIPNKIIFDNYAVYFTHSNILIWLLNSFLLYSITVAGIIIVNIMTAYGFSKFKFKLKKVIIFIFLSTLLFPGQTLLIPKIVQMRNMSLSNTWLAIILPALSSPLLMILIKNYIDTIPDDYIDSARIDGASEYRILFQIILPLCKPIISVVTIITTIGLFTNYIWQNLMLRSKELQTLIVGITNMILNMQGWYTRSNPIGIMLAGGCLLLIPILFIFILFSKQIKNGLNIGGLK